MKWHGSIIKPQCKGRWQLKHTILLFHLYYACQAFRFPFLLLYSLSLAPFFKLTTLCDYGSVSVDLTDQVVQ